MFSLIITNIVVSNVKQSGRVIESKKAYYAAEGALEMALLENSKHGVGYSNNIDDIYGCSNQQQGSGGGVLAEKLALMGRLRRRLSMMVMIQILLVIMGFRRLGLGMLGGIVILLRRFLIGLFGLGRMRIRSMFLMGVMFLILLIFLLLVLKGLLLRSILVIGIRLGLGRLLVFRFM
jgi:hypothetical protein